MTAELELFPGSYLSGLANGGQSYATSFPWHCIPWQEPCLTSKLSIQFYLISSFIVHKSHEKTKTPKACWFIFNTVIS